MSSLKKQQGMVLFITLMILPMLILMGLVTMSGSMIDLKMIDARISHNESRLNLDATAKHITSIPANHNTFIQAINGTVYSSAVFTASDATTEVLGEVTCKRRKNANGENFNCKYLNLSLSERYGRHNNNDVPWGRNVLSIGIEQPYFAD